VRQPSEPHPGVAARLTVPGAVRARQGQRAGIVTRVAAGAVDLAAAFVAVAVLYAVWAAALFLLHPRRFRFPEPGGQALLTALLLLLTAYLAFAWSTTGQTYGDRLLGLRVLDRHGRRPGVVLALTRAILCVLFPVLLLWVVVSRQNRSVQDVLLHTSVVYDWTLAPSTEPRTRGR
jgi:uncharacterized RDD family membrane protein YckC